MIQPDMTAQQKREALADMVAGGRGIAFNAIYEEVDTDGSPCFCIYEPNGKWEPCRCVCDTREHAEALQHIGELNI